MSHIAISLSFLLNLLHPPLPELHPYDHRAGLEGQYQIQERIKQVLRYLRAGRDYQRLSLCEFNLGLSYLATSQNAAAEESFHTARFHSSLISDYPLVCLAYFAEGHVVQRPGRSLENYRKTQQRLQRFKEFLHPGRPNYRLTLFVRRLEQQLELWRHRLDGLLSAAVPQPVITPGEAMELFQPWFKLDEDAFKRIPTEERKLFKDLGSEDWVLAETEQITDERWYYGDLWIVSEKDRVGHIRLRRHPQVEDKVWYMGKVIEWIKDEFTNEVIFRTAEERDHLGMRPRDNISGIIITHYHYQERGLIDLV